MELALKRKQHSKWILLPLIVLCLVMLVPSSIVLANALTDPYIGRSGIDNSDLTAGFNNSSDLLIDWDNPGHINPSSAVYPVMIIVPLIFFALALLILLGMAFTEGLTIKGLIIVGILIFIALALLAGVNFSTNSLLGG